VGRDGDLAADADQIALQRQIGRPPAHSRPRSPPAGAIDQVGEIAQAAQLFERRIVLEAIDQHDRLGQLALADMLLDRRIEAGVERLVEMARLQLIAQPLIGALSK